MSCLLRSFKYSCVDSSDILYLQHSLYITNSKHVWVCWAWTCGYMHANGFFLVFRHNSYFIKGIKPLWTCQSLRQIFSRPTSVISALLERRQLGRETVERRCWRQASPDSCVREEEREKESYGWSRGYLFSTFRWISLKFSVLLCPLFLSKCIWEHKSHLQMF